MFSVAAAVMPGVSIIRVSGCIRLIHRLRGGTDCKCLTAVLNKNIVEVCRVRAGQCARARVEVLFSTFGRKLLTNMLRAGFVGLPDVGKTTLFNAVTAQSSALIANYAFSTSKPNVGVVAVPDERLQPLAKVVKTEVLVPASVEFVDIAGLVRARPRAKGWEINSCTPFAKQTRSFMWSAVLKVTQSFTLMAESIHVATLKRFRSNSRWRSRHRRTSPRARAENS